MQCKRFMLWLMCIGFGLVPVTAAAQILDYWDLGGTEVCTGVEKQDSQIVISDGTGGAFVAWLETQDTDLSLYVQKLGPDGGSQWGAGGVLVCDSDGITYPDIYDYAPCQMAPDGDGGVIVTWSDHRPNVFTGFVQKIDRDGNVLWDYNGIECWGGGGSGFSIEMTNVVPDGCGGALIFGYAWWGSLYLQKVDADGNLMLGSEFGYFEALPTNMKGGDKGPFHAISDGAGGAYVTWETDYGDIYLTRLDRNVDFVWEFTQQIVKVCDQEDRQFSPRLAPDRSGGVIVSWYDCRFDDQIGVPPDPVAIFAQRIDHLGYVYDDPECPSCIWSVNPDGIQVSPEFLMDVWVNNGPIMVSDDYGASMHVWADDTTGDFDIYAQRLEGNGWKSNAWGPAPDGVPIAVVAGSNQFLPTLANDGDHGAFVAWQDQRDSQYAVYIQHIDHNGTGDLQWIELEGATNGDPVNIQDESQSRPLLAADWNILTWVDKRNEGIYGADVYAQKYEPHSDFLKYIDAESVLISEYIVPENIQYECLCDTYYSEFRKGQLADNGVTYQVGKQAKVGFLSSVEIRKEDAEARVGSNCLAFRAESLPDEGWCVKQRTEVIFPDTDIPFNEARYSGFSLMIPTSSENPTPLTTIELCDGSTVEGAPWFTIVKWGQVCGEDVASNGALGMNLVTKLEGQEEVLYIQLKGMNEDEASFLIWENVCPKGVWMDFVVGYKFDPTGCGWVRFYLNENLVGQHDGKLGQPIHTQDDYAANEQSIGDPSFGLYRMQMPRTCEVYFDEIRYGLTYEEVLPGSNPSLVPVLSSPNDGALITYNPDVGLLFRWYLIPGVYDYEFQLDDNAAFSSPYVDTSCPCNDGSGLCSVGVSPLEPDTYYWRVKTRDYGLWSDVWSFRVKTSKSPNPDPHPNKPHSTFYPNPLNPATTISFSLPKQEHVRLQIFDMHGKLVTTLVDESRGMGQHDVVWRGTNARGMNVASGLYFYRFEAGETVIKEKLMLLK